MSSFLTQAPVDSFIFLGEKLEQYLNTLLEKPQQDLHSYLNGTYPSVLQTSTSFLEKIQNPFSKRLPLMNPFHVLVLCLAYLVIVFLGIQVMSFFPKFTLKTFSKVHNFFLMTLSFYMGFNILKEAGQQGYSLFGNPVDQSEKGFKVIMFLKKNNRQISFLHLYHHSSIFAVWWLVIFWAPGGEAYFSAAFNSFIHVVMYGYYLFHSFGITQVSFIKKYITMMQMTQFVCMMIQSMVNMYKDFNSIESVGGSSYPFTLSCVLFFYMQTM
ncbi:hypothetical protein HDU92_002708 [Lobulomyces angularis]|nr:hypothetical protein HDU92_002708 [Lobulomyces angularis]